MVHNIINTFTGTKSFLSKPQLFMTTKIQVYTVSQLP